LRFGLLGVYTFREWDFPIEFAVAPFGAISPAQFVFMLYFSFAVKNQRTVRDLHLDILSS